MYKGSWWFYFECLNQPCADNNQCVVDIRLDNQNTMPDIKCPICAEEMRIYGTEEADENGY
jgi:hypothetical protein